VVLRSCPYRVRSCVLYCDGWVLRAVARVGAFVSTRGVLQCLLCGALTFTDTENVLEPLLLFFSCADQLVLDCFHSMFTVCTCSQNSLTFLWKGRKSVPGSAAAAASGLVPGATASASNGKGSLVKKGTGGQPLPLRSSRSATAIVAPSPKRLKRTQAQLMAAAAAAASGELVWQVDGADVSVAPPAWDPASASALLCSQITAHNSYVSALETQRVAEAVAAVAEEIAVLSAIQTARSEAAAVDVGAGVGPGVGADVGTTDADVDADAGAESDVDVDKVDPRANKRRQVDEHKEPTAAAAASGEEDEIVVVSRRPADMTHGVRRRHRGRQVVAAKGECSAVTEYSESGIRKPRIQALRSYLNTKLHTLFLAPDCADDVFHSFNGRIAFLESVVMRVGKVGQGDAQTLLKEDFMVPAKSDGSEPSPKKLKPWLGKALNKVHYNLKEVIVRAWDEAMGYEGTNAEAGRFLKGRQYLMESVGRRGVLMAYLAAVNHCGGEADQYAFPDGEEGAAIVAVKFATLSFVLSKVPVTFGVGYLLLCE